VSGENCANLGIAGTLFVPEIGGATGGLPCGTGATPSLLLHPCNTPKAHAITLAARFARRISAATLEVVVMYAVMVICSAVTAVAHFFTLPRREQLACRTRPYTEETLPARISR
jgi:hypothetical protein